MNPFGVIGIIIGITNIAIGLLVYAHDRRNINNQLWALFAVSVSIWGFGSYIISISTTPESALLWWRVTHVGVILIPFSFLAFAYSFLDIKSRIIKWFTVIASILFLLLDTTSYLMSSVRWVFNSFYYDGPPTLVYDMFVVSFILAIFYALLISFKAYLASKDSNRKLQILFFMLAALVGSLGGSTSFLPVYGIYIYPYLNATIILFPFIIGYAILRYGLFSLKAIATELLIFTLWIFVLLRALLATSYEDIWMNLVLLLVLIFIGVLLIRSVRKEIQTRERIELLAADLRKANDRLTELDRQKSEFVSFATHQLRAPLTAMKGYASLLLEGDMGKLPDEAKQGIERIFDSTKTLTSIVDDYLNVSRIELGTMKYAFETIDLKMLIEDTIAELKPNIDKSGLKFSFEAENTGADWRITADRDKLKQVIANVIDNSMKYTPKGSIAVTLALDKAAHKFVFKVKDTGVGIAPETLPRLFQKFSRADNANKVNIRGTGLGLFVAKQMVEAHHGTIRAESEGEGKGSTFIVELEPLAKA